jgi:hypothetical protein
MLRSQKGNCFTGSCILTAFLGDSQAEIALIAVAAAIGAVIGLAVLFHYHKRRQGGLVPGLIHWGRNLKNTGTKMQILPPDSARWSVPL